MTLNRLVFKTHKWLAVGVGFFTLLWFGSGVVMMLPKGIVSGRANDPLPIAAPDFKGIRVTVPQAVEAAEAAAGRKFTTESVDLRVIEGRLYYQVTSAKPDWYLIDAVSGARLEITAEYAKQMASRAMGGRPVKDMVFWPFYTSEYTYGPRPVYRVAFDDPAKTVVYLHPYSGELRTSNRLGRIRLFIMGTHTFDFLRDVVSSYWIKFLLALFSFVGLCMSLFGGWILLIQFLNWRARRAGRATEA